MSYGLEGVKVIETASVAAGPMTGRLLADWGADVIHIDHTIRKAQMQRMRANQPRANMNYWAQSTGRNKRGMALNLSTERGREIIVKMLEKADILLSNFRPYELEKFRLDYNTLSKINPRIICANLTGFGSKGPDKDAPAYGPIAGDSRGGMLYSLMFPGGNPPQMSGTLVDYLTGLTLACGISTALYSREKTGVGQLVEASLFQTMVFALSGDIANTLATGQDRGTVDRRDVARPLTSPYKTKDGRWIYLWIGMGADQVWPRFCRAIEREDLVADERFSTPAQMSQNYLDLYDILDEVFASKTLEEWRPRLNAGDFPWSPIQNFIEVTKDPQARANDFFLPLKMPSGETMEVVANPLKFNRIPDRVITPAPEVGQHTDEILIEYGYNAEDIAKFREEGVIG